MAQRAGAWRGVAAVLCGAALLIWPALVNGYPLLFSDSGGFLHQTLGPLMIWDKPYVYGPFLHAFHWRISLWGPAVAQGLIVSHLLWLTQRCLRGEAGALMHVGLTAAVTFLTTAPFTVALLMPDVFASVTILALFLLGLAHDRLGRAEAWYLGALATVAIAAHLSHLPLAAALVAVAVLVDRLQHGRWQALRAALPLVAALAVLLVTNAVGHGRVSLSPHGATFMLARLQADGPAAAVIRARCPEAGWYLCAFVERLPMDSDEFLWSPDSPVNRDADGASRFLGGAMLSPEAGAIVAETVRTHPVAVVAAMLRNTALQLVTLRIGDTIGSDHLFAVWPRLAEGFPPRELAAFQASLQTQGRLLDALLPFALPHLPVLLLALITLGIWCATPARDSLCLGFMLCVMVGLLANAFATGALSKPHHRYEARVAWLLPAAALLILMPARRRSGRLLPDQPMKSSS